MHDTIEINKGILNQNDKIAHQVIHILEKNNILGINVMGAPGIGKTTTIINLINSIKKAPAFAQNEDCFVIEGDIESDIDTVLLKKLGISSFQINTFGACHLDAPQVLNAIQNIDFSAGGFLFIENVGNLVCPAEFSIGEHLKLLICSVTEGSDKPYKYPLAFEKADIIILNKIDLAPFVSFDKDFWESGIRKVNSSVPIFETSINATENVDSLANLLIEKHLAATSKT